MQRWRAAGGQATSEYVALVALVALTLALAAGLTAGGLGGELLAGLQRGLCGVADVRCPTPQRPRDELAPCPLERTTSAESLTGAFEVVELGNGGALTAVRLSDGRVQVTLADVDTAGGAVGLGFSIGRGNGASVAVELQQRFATGRSWTLPDAAAARAFVARYGAKATVTGKAVDMVRAGCSILCDAVGWRPHPALPPADETAIDRGFSGRFAGGLGLAGLEASNGRLLGARLRRDGHSTWYLGFDAAVGAALLSSAGLGVGSRSQVVVAFDLDAQQRPAALSVETVVSDGSFAMLQAADGRASARVDGAAARVTELTGTLDLRDARNRAVAAAFRAALDDRLAAAQLQHRAAAIGQRLAHTGVIDRRTYVVTGSATALGGRLTLGGRIGAGFERTREGMRLLTAETRLPGLPFLPRDDCRAG